MIREISRATIIGIVLLAAGCASGPRKTAPVAPPASGGPVPISGPAYSIDGDTVIVGGTLVDLWGVEAPSINDSDGWFARASLDAMIGPGGSLLCTPKYRSGGRMRAVCANNLVGDVGRALLASGWAVTTRDDTRQGSDAEYLGKAYEATEIRARLARLGLWARNPGP